MEVVMNKLQMVKDSIDSWFSEHPKYIVTNERIVEHPLKKELMTFNINFYDNQRKVRYNDIRYNTTGFENEAGECRIQIDARFLTGVNEDIDENLNKDGYEINIKNMGYSGEAMVKLQKSVDGQGIDFNEAVEMVTEQGIKRLIV
jgi:hypothetical protein